MSLAASGKIASRMHLALDASNLLEAGGIAVRVVGMSSRELFGEQPSAFRDDVLPPALGARLAIEAASPMGWERWVGDHGAMVGIDRFGASAPGPVVYERLGFTPDEVARRARAVPARRRPAGSP
ncbi:MAG: hypothetical protein WEB06_15335 [Actinomycetota bacterium]